MKNTCYYCKHGGKKYKLDSKVTIPETWCDLTEKNELEDNPFIGWHKIFDSCDKFELEKCIDCRYCVTTGEKTKKGYLIFNCLKDKFKNISDFSNIKTCKLWNDGKFNV